MSLRSDLRQVLARVLVSMNDVWIWCIDQHKSGTAPSHDLVAGHLRDLSTALREARLLVEDDDALEHTSKAVDDDLMALWQVMAAQGAASPALVRRLIDDFVDERARAEAEMRALLRPVANSG
ncbi:MAG: hypothetical protein QOC82_2756 [Frankiaceae bacterium]|nr:hypothetical protein [Frankiaceae bacterium]